MWAPAVYFFQGLIELGRWHAEGDCLSVSEPCQGSSGPSALKLRRAGLIGMRLIRFEWIPLKPMQADTISFAMHTQLLASLACWCVPV